MLVVFLFYITAGQRFFEEKLQAQARFIEELDNELEQERKLVQETRKEVLSDKPIAPLELLRRQSVSLYTRAQTHTNLGHLDAREGGQGTQDMRNAFQTHPCTHPTSLHPQTHTHQVIGEATLVAVVVQHQLPAPFPPTTNPGTYVLHGRSTLQSPTIGHVTIT